LRCPAYAFEEILAAFGDATGVSGAADTMLSQVEAMAQCITGDYALRIPDILEKDRTDVLAKYAFDPEEQSEDLKLKQVREPDARANDIDFLRGVMAKEQQWRESKFYWRKLLSRREVDLLTDEDRTSFGRNMAYYYANSVRAHRFLRAIDLAAITVYLLILPIGAAIYVLSSTYGQIADKFLPPYNETFYGIDSVFLRLLIEGLWVGLGWLLIGVLLSVPVYRFGDRPYGMRLHHVFRLVMAGPTRTDEIHDYEASEQRGLKHLASNRK
jgi:hypothetical protein